jgi:hypothetical protein
MPFVIANSPVEKTWQPPCDFFDSASTDILPLFGIDELKQ